MKAYSTLCETVFYGAGDYVVVDPTDRKLCVSVTRDHPGKWIARARWCRFTYSDYLPTKTQATAAAKEMIAEEAIRQPNL